jgi:hypothetical protein
MSKNRSGPGAGALLPLATSQVVQTAANWACAAATITVTLASDPTPPNKLIAVLAGPAGDTPSLAQPVQTGFNMLSQCSNPCPLNQPASLTMAYYSRLIQAGDGKSWVFSTPNAGGIYITGCALYEITPYGGIQASEATGWPPDGLQITSFGQCMGIAAAVALPSLGGVISWGGDAPSPLASWPGNGAGDHELYDPTNTYYGAMQVTASLNAHPIPGGSTCQPTFTYTPINGSNYQAVLGLVLFNPAQP